jgi:hypothetical protein
MIINKRPVAGVLNSGCSDLYHHHAKNFTSTETYRINKDVGRESPTIVVIIITISFTTAVPLYPYEVPSNKTFKFNMNALIRPCFVDINQTSAHKCQLVWVKGF